MKDYINTTSYIPSNKDVEFKFNIHKIDHTYSDNIIHNYDDLNTRRIDIHTYINSESRLPVTKIYTIVISIVILLCSIMVPAYSSLSSLDAYIAYKEYKDSLIEEIIIDLNNSQQLIYSYAFTHNNLINELSRLREDVSLLQKQIDTNFQEGIISSFLIFKYIDQLDTILNKTSKNNLSNFHFITLEKAQSKLIALSENKSNYFEMRSKIKIMTIFLIIILIYLTLVLIYTFVFFTKQKRENDIYKKNLFLANYELTKIMERLHLLSMH